MTDREPTDGMDAPEPDDLFVPALERLRAGAPADAAGLLAGVAAARPERAGEARLLEVACWARARDWDAVIARTGELPAALRLQVVLGLRGAALALKGRRGEGLAAAGEALFAARRPLLPDPTDPLMGACWDLLDEVDLRGLEAELAALAALAAAGDPEGDAGAKAEAGPGSRQSRRDPSTVNRLQSTAQNGRARSTRRKNCGLSTDGCRRPRTLSEALEAGPGLEVIRGAVAVEPDEAAARLADAVDAGLATPELRVAFGRLLRLADARERARKVLDRIDGMDRNADVAQRRAAERAACDRDDELCEATRVALERGAERRVIRAEQGVYLTITDPAAERATVRLLEGPAVGGVLKDVVNDYLDRGFVVVDWTLAASLEELEAALLEAQSKGDTEAALRAGRELLVRAPDDARLAALGLAASVAHRGYAGSVALSQRSLTLAEEPDWALRQHAAVLFAAGHFAQCLGALCYLRECYGPESMTPDAWALLVRCFAVPRHRPALAEALADAGRAQHGEGDDLALLVARARLDAEDNAGALEALAPALAAADPPAEAFCLALQAHLEGGLEGTEALAQRAARTHPGSGLVGALALEVADRPGPALKAYRALMEEADGPAAALDVQLQAMRAALRVGAYEDGLRLAREAQTSLGEPDARCLAVVYACLRALEPSEDREDLAAMVAEARARAADPALPRGLCLQAILAAGIYLDPAALEPFWAELAPTATADGDEDTLRPQTPSLGEGLSCVATGTGFAALFDEPGLAAHLAGAPPDWLGDADRLAATREAGRLALAAGHGPVLWIRVTAAPVHPADQGRFARQQTQPLVVTSGRVFVGPGEALRVGAEPSVAATLGVELGGRHFYLPPGRYRVTAYQRTAEPWPEDDLRTDPCDMIFHLQKGG